MTTATKLSPKSMQKLNNRFIRKDLEGEFIVLKVNIKNELNTTRRGRKKQSMMKKRGQNKQKMLFLLEQNRIISMIYFDCL